MRNQFLCEIPESVRDHLSRQDVEYLDCVFDEIDTDDWIEDEDGRNTGGDLAQRLN